MAMMGYVSPHVFRPDLTGDAAQWFCVLWGIWKHGKCMKMSWENMGFIWFYSFTWWENKKTTFLLKGFHWAKLGSFHSNVAQKEKNRHLLRLTPRCLQQSVSTPSTPKTVAMGLPSSLLLWMAGDYGWTSLDVLGRDRSWILILPP